MELKFLGKGGSDNQFQGNTSAYFIEKECLFLIDCGENIFERILKQKILDSVNKIFLFITHTHSDHVGSIGSFLFHCYFIRKIEFNIVLPSNALHYNDIKELLRIYGASEDWYKIIEPKELDNKFNLFNTVEYMITKHVNQINCYGILFDTNNGVVYYSGDTREINNIKGLIKSGKKIDKIYIDCTTTSNENNVHYYVGKANEELSEEIKNKVYCMHFNKPECIKVAKSYGFNVVEVEETKNIY